MAGLFCRCDLCSSCQCLIISAIQIAVTAHVFLHFITTLLHWFWQELDWKPQVKSQRVKQGRCVFQHKQHMDMLNTHKADIITLVWTSCASVDELSRGRAMSHWCCLLIRSLQETSVSEILTGMWSQTSLFNRGKKKNLVESAGHHNWNRRYWMWYSNLRAEHAVLMKQSDKRLNGLSIAKRGHGKIETTKAPWGCLWQEEFLHVGAISDRAFCQNAAVCVLRETQTHCCLLLTQIMIFS